MYSSRMVHILLVGLAFLLATKAAWQPRNVHGRDLIGSLLGGEADDETTTSSAADPTTSSSDPTTSSEAPTTTTESTTTESTDSSTSTTDEPTTSTTDEPTSSTPPPTTTTSTSTTDGGDGGDTGLTTTTTSATEGQTPTTAATTTTDGQTSQTSQAGQTTETKTSTTAKPYTTSTTIVFTSTDSEGHTFTSSTLSQVVQTPGLSGSGSSSKNTGLSPKEKSTVIGVTVGVGGAIVLAALGVLFWRLRSKKRSNEEQEELVSYGEGFGGPGAAEKTTEPSPGASRSPFQSTLESYHAPSSTNAASNF
ncbi:hypothetical protein F5Y18DRAFT_345747 [Xylariaceae sp. FL1019]|nr:hypothetical protein F5Y18DRAFT_345747 [Xylariaceae sp. FL1019]